jgi:hypothetical protein
MKETYHMKQDTYENVILKCKFKKQHGKAGRMMQPLQAAEYKGSKINIFKKDILFSAFNKIYIFY